MASRQPEDRELFITFIGKLIEPITRETIVQVEQWEQQRVDQEGEPLPIDEFVFEIERRLLAKLYDFAQTDGKLSMLLIPVMGYLRKIPQ